MLLSKFKWNALVLLLGGDGKEVYRCVRARHTRLEERGTFITCYCIVLKTREKFRTTHI